MGLSKTEINLRRLLAAAPQQENQAKLIHYVATLRDQLAELTGEGTAGGLPSISTSKAREYAEKIEALAEKIDSYTQIHTCSHGHRMYSNIKRRLNEAFVYCLHFLCKRVKNIGARKPDTSWSEASEPSRVSDGSLIEEVPAMKEKNVINKGNIASTSSTPILRKRHVYNSNDQIKDEDNVTSQSKSSIKLDASSQRHIEKHRRLQEDLTDEMVGLAHQLKETSLMMNQSLLDTEKTLDSTEQAVEHSLASTGRANERAGEIYSQSFKTSCFTWLMIFVMSCMFLLVVFLIRIT